jgi:predicted ribosomally synthesized peptide with SipW-like signal peptide
LGFLALSIANENPHFLLAVLALVALTIAYFASRETENNYFFHKELTYSDYWDEIRPPCKKPWYFIRTGYEPKD